MNFKLLAGVVLIALVISFTLQNTEIVNIALLFWSVSMSRAVMIFIVFLVGLISGWLLHSYSRHRKRARSGHQ